MCVCCLFVCRAESATKAKLEKVAEIKRLNAQLVATKKWVVLSTKSDTNYASILKTVTTPLFSEISRNNDALKELRTYRQFLDSLAPQEWRDQRSSARQLRRKSKTDNSGRKTSPKFESEENGTIPSASAGATGSAARGAQGGVSEDQCSSDEDEPVELYFTDPHQLIAIFTELEEQNLSLIQNSQETEKTLEEIGKQQRKATEQRMWANMTW